MAFKSRIGIIMNNMIKATFFILLFCIGCSPVYYSPITHNVPLFKEKNETEISASVDYLFKNGADFLNMGAGINFQGAYSTGDHTLAMLNLAHVYTGPLISTSDKDTRRGTYELIEAGYGYYQFRPSQNFFFQTIGIIGYGGVVNRFPKTVKDHPDSDGILKAKMLNVFVQPTVGFQSSSERSEIAFSLKSGMVNYMNITGNLFMKNLDPQNKESQQDFLKSQKNQFMMEPAITLRMGSPSLKFQLQFGANLDLSNSNFPREYIWFGLGLRYHLKGK